MGLPTRAWATSGTWLLGEFVTNGGDVYQCVAAGAGATSGGGPSGTGASITDGAAAVWDFVDSYQPTRWDITIGANAGKNNETAPSAAVAAAAFATDAKPASALINYLFMQVDRMLLWLTNMLGYPLTWTGLQTFAALLTADDGILSAATITTTGAANLDGVVATGGSGSANGVTATGTGTGAGIVATSVGTGPGGSFSAGAWYGIVTAGNATKAPIALGTSAPSAALAIVGDIYVGGGHLYVCLVNGAWTTVI